MNRHSHRLAKWLATLMLLNSAVSFALVDHRLDCCPAETTPIAVETPMQGRHLDSATPVESMTKHHHPSTGGITTSDAMINHEVADEGATGTQCVCEALSCATDLCLQSGSGFGAAAPTSVALVGDGSPTGSVLPPISAGVAHRALEPPFKPPQA